MNSFYSTAFGDMGLIIKGFFYILILIYSSYEDYRTKTILDKVHLGILILGMFQSSLAPGIAGFICVPIPFLMTVFMKGGGIGGGDVKFMAANGFMLGMKGGFIASVIGLILAIAVNSIIYKIKGKDKNISFPLAPYLSVGCFLVYLIQT